MITFQSYNIFGLRVDDLFIDNTQCPTVDQLAVTGRQKGSDATNEAQIALHLSEERTCPSHLNLTIYDMMRDWFHHVESHDIS